MINPTPARIEDILNSSAQFAVPAYQRDYTWGKDEALEFFDDLKSYVDTGTGALFLGTLIFDTSVEESEKKIKVVDGQQRITTILLFLIACRSVARKINATELAALIQNKITFTDQTTGEPFGCRLISSDTIRDVFEVIASDNKWDGYFSAKVGNKPVKRQVNRIKPIYEFFFEKIEGIDQPTLSKFLKAIYNAYVVRINIAAEEEAFSIFERTNARGVDLEASDLLKNYLFKSRVEGLEDKWPQVIENSDGTLLRMLKYFYVANNGYVTKSELYKKLKSYGDKKGQALLVDEIYKFSQFYDAIRKANKDGIKDYFHNIDCKAISQDQSYSERIYYAIEGLRLFKIAQIYPLLYAAISCFIREGGSNDKKLSKRLIRMFEDIEKYHFINTAICNRMGNEVEKLYADYCVKYAENAFESTTNNLFKELKQKLATESEFIASYSEITYSQDTIPLIAYIFDRMNNAGLMPGQRVQLYNPDPKLIRRNHNIEHIYPKSPENMDTMEDVDNIGNLLVISFKTNSTLSNKSPKEKFELLNGKLKKEIQNISYVEKFLDTYNAYASPWDDRIIEDRAKADATFAYQNVWKLS